MLNSFENVVEADVIFISHGVGHILHIVKHAGQSFRRKKKPENLFPMIL